MHYAMNDQLNEVAVGNVVASKGKLMHDVRMSNNLDSLLVPRVLDGCEDVDPSKHPQGENEGTYYNLIDCWGWKLRWSKT